MLPPESGSASVREGWQANDHQDGCDGVTMDVRSEWLYFAPLSGRSLYRVRVADLNDEKLTPTELSAKVERYSDKPNNRGLSIDYAGNLT
jgi:hypothetical protein